MEREMGLDSVFADYCSSLLATNLFFSMRHGDEYHFLSCLFLCNHCPGLQEVSSAKGRKEVVQGHLSGEVSDVYGRCELLALFRVEQVVRPVRLNIDCRLGSCPKPGSL